MDIQQILRPLQQFEEKLGELYSWFAQVHAIDLEFAAVFNRLAMEEKSHAAQLDYHRRLARQNPKLFDRVDLDLAVVLAALERVEQVRSEPAPPTIAAAVGLALELESGAADYHFRNALAQLNPEVSRLLGSLGRGDQVHYQRLLELAQRRGLLGPDTPVPAPAP